MYMYCTLYARPTAELNEERLLNADKTIYNLQAMIITDL